MQFSTNSDEAIASLISAAPTLIGQYRQATLQLRDRQLALEHAQIAFKRSNHEIAIMTLELRQLTEKADKGDRIASHQASIKELDIESKLLTLRSEEELVEDAKREINACIRELERITRESGVDYGTLPVEQFQEHMKLDSQLKRARWLAANYLGAIAGMPPAAAELWLETPVEQRKQLIDNAFDFVRSLPLPAGEGDMELEMIEGGIDE